MSRQNQLILAVSLILLPLLFLLLSPGVSEAGPDFRLQDDRTTIVGLYHNPPFAIKTEDAAWDGIAVHLWREIADELEIEYELREIDRDKVVPLLQAGPVDVVITAIATANQEEQIDFTHSFFTSSLAIAEPQQRTFWEIVGAIFSPRFIQISLWLSVFFAIIGVIVWLFERKANEEQFGGNPLRGIWAGFWWAGVTMSTIGYGDKAPITVGGRLLAFVWMLVAMGITASLTATITSVLTLQSGFFSTTVPDLRQMDVGSIADSGIAAYLETERIQFQPYQNPLEGLKAVQAEEIEAFVYDSAALHFVNSEELNGSLNIGITDRELHRHAFALAAESDLHELLNQKLLEKTSNSAWRDLVERYLPEQSTP